MISLERAGLFPKNRLGPQVFIASAQDSCRLEVLQLTQELRDGGIAAEFDLKDRPLSRQIEYADSAKIPYLIVLGPKELESRKVNVKSMTTRQETQVPMNELSEKLRALN